MAIASDPASPCPLCRGTGWKMVPTGAADSSYTMAAVRCECQVTQRTEELQTEAGIPSRYRHCTLDNFVSDDIRELTVAHGLVTTYAGDYPGSIDRDRNGLLLYGGVGTGKTHLAVAVVQRLLDRGIACRFCDYRDLLKRIQATFDAANPATEAGVIGPLLNVEVLILDDLGVGRATEWAQETLHYLLNHRYCNRLATIVTTNLEDLDWAQERKDATLGQYATERLRSRLHEMCKFIPMHGRDFRRVDSDRPRSLE